MSLTYIINQVIRLDPDIDLYLQPLNNKTIAITCSDFSNKTFYCVFTDNQLEILSSKPEIINTYITGPLIDFLTLAIKKQNADLRETQIKITGEINTAELAQQLLFKLDIDWEEELSKYTGDVIAHQAIYLIKQLKSYQQQASASLEEMITEYLQEESGLLPTKHEITEFMNEVDELRMRVDRVQARVKAYENN